MRLLTTYHQRTRAYAGLPGTIGLLLLLVLFTTSCSKKEKALQPSGIPEGYTLPQGNQPFDQEIVDFHNQFETYIIYKFKQSDFYLTISDLIQDTAIQPDPAYAGPAYQFVRKNMLNHYAPAFLKKNLPYKILLTAGIDSLTKVEYINDVRTLTYMRSSGFRNTNTMIAFGWANPELAAKTEAEQKNLRGLLNSIFWKFMIEYRKMEIPTGFTALMQSTFSLNEGNKFSRGYLAVPMGIGSLEHPKFDLLSYIAIITSWSQAELEATLLSPSVDTGGWIRKKYNLVTSYYLSKYNIDLQAIGNSALGN